MTEHAHNGPRYPHVVLDYPVGENIFQLGGRARALMRRAGVSSNEIKAMTDQIRAAGSYDDACDVIRRWVTWEDCP